MKIDAHLHVNFKKYTPSKLIEYLDSNRIDQCWLLTWEEICPGRWPYKHLSIDEVYDMFIRHPSRIIPMYAPDPHRENASDLLTFWHGKGIKGCAELKATLNWKSTYVRALLSTVERLKIPVLFHMQEAKEIIMPLENDSARNIVLVKLLQSNKLREVPKNIFNIIFNYFPGLSNWRKNRTVIVPGYMLDLAYLEATLQKFPNVDFVGHGPLFWKDFGTSQNEPGSSDGYNFCTGEEITYSMLKKYSNLYADISGSSGLRALRRNLKFTRYVLQELRNKVLFGTDNIQGHELLLMSLNLGQDTLRKIFGENAASLVDR